MSDLLSYSTLRMDRHNGVARSVIWNTLYPTIHEPFPPVPQVYAGMTWEDHLTECDALALRSFLAQRRAGLLFPRNPRCWEVLFMAQLTIPVPKNTVTEQKIQTIESWYSARRVRLIDRIWNAGLDTRAQGLVAAVASTFLLTEVGVDCLSPAETLVMAHER